MRGVVSSVLRSAPSRAVLVFVLTILVAIAASLAPRSPGTPTDEARCGRSAGTLSQIGNLSRIGTLSQIGNLSQSTEAVGEPRRGTEPPQLAIDGPGQESGPLANDPVEDGPEPELAALWAGPNESQHPAARRGRRGTVAPLGDWAHRAPSGRSPPTAL